MKGEWCYFKSYFSKEWCDDILNSFEDSDYNESYLGETDSTQDKSFRNSKIAWLDQNDLTWDTVYKDIWTVQRRANQDWFGFHVEGSENIQLSRYDGENNEWYGKHRDTFFLTSSPTQRKLSAIIQLTDPNEYEGGDFTLFDCESFPNRDDIRQQGTIIFFPSFTFHQANPVTKGVRHSLALWFNGPHWR